MVCLLIPSPKLRGYGDGDGEIGWQNTKCSIPCGYMKASCSKPRKKQAGATEDASQGSLKSALKVAKPTGTGLVKTAHKSVVQVAQPHADQQSSENEPHKRFAKTSGAEAPKGILKSSLQHSTGFSTTNNMGSSSLSKQDAQRQQKLNLVENEDEFDLDGALDDLGSFLETWDTEKQAAGIA